MSENNKRYVYFVSYVINEVINGTIPIFGNSEIRIQEGQIAECANGEIVSILDINYLEKEICRSLDITCVDSLSILYFQLLRTEDI